MKIIFLTNHLKGNDGWSKYSLEIIEGMQKRGHDVLCLTSCGSGQNKIKELIFLRPPLSFLANFWLSWITARRMEKIVREFSPEVIHILVEPYATIIPFLKKGNYKIYLTIHGTYSVLSNLINNHFKKIISRFLSQRYYRRLDGIISVSNYTKQYLYSKFLKHSNLRETMNKIVVITNGVNLEKNKIIDLKEKPVNKIKKILFVGAVKDKKGILQAIEAVKYYRDNFSDRFIYDIVGSYDEKSGYFKELEKRIEIYNLQNQIFLRGMVSDREREEYYIGADLFLMLPIDVSGKFEGFGLVFLEANTKGVPCIGSNNSGCVEAIKNDISGYLTDPNNYQETADKINMVLNQGKISKIDCVNWAKQNSIDKKIEEIIKIYG